MAFKKLMKKFDGKVIASTAVGATIGVGVLGLILFNSDKVENVPVVGDTLMDAKAGLSGQTANDNQPGFFGRLFGGGRR